jgi:hypothetical protein
MLVRDNLATAVYAGKNKEQAACPRPKGRQTDPVDDVSRICLSSALKDIISALDFDL